MRNSAQVGGDLSGALWRRSQDRLGVAVVSNGLSAPHREYLRLGGQGFLLWDRTLRYGREDILEMYYTTHVWRGVSASGGLQYIDHPGQPDSESTLTEIVKLLTDTPDLKLRIEGSTDNVGQPAVNQALSERRAQAVVAWLTTDGVSANRLPAKGLGQANPVADNGTEEGRAKNRRVELFKM